VGASDENAANTLSKDTQFGQPANQFYPPPPCYSYPPSQAPFPGAPSFYHPAQFNNTPSSQPSCAATGAYLSYGPSWEEYNFHQAGYGGSQMNSPQQFTGQGPSFSGAPRVPPAPPRNIPVIRLNSSTTTPYGSLPGIPGRPHICLPAKHFQPAAEPSRTDVAGIADLPPLPEIS
jgi:hypothetical protein